jgi:hypothetical protein
MSMVCLIIGLLSCLIFKNKKQVEKNCNKLNIKEMFDFSIAKNWRFLIWVAADILLEGAFNIPYYFLPCKTRR